MGLLAALAAASNWSASALRDGEHLRVLLGDAVVRDHALAPGFRKFGQGIADFRLPLRIHHQRKQVGLGEITVVVRLFLGAHAVGFAFVRVVEAGFLRDLAAGFNHANLPLNLVLQRFADKAERVDVLHFRLGAKFFLSARPHADVAIAAQRTFLHVAVADPGVEDDLLQAGEVFVSFVGRSDVRLADDFDQRHAAAIQIDGRSFRGVGEAFVQALARVFFQVQAGDADLLRAAVDLDLDGAMLGQRLVVLRNLVALGQVGIEIILAGKDRSFVDAAVQRHGRQRGELHCLAVQHRQGSRQAQADGTDVGVGRIAEVGGAGAENLGRGQKLDVHLQPDDRLVLRRGRIRKCPAWWPYH